MLLYRLVPKKHAKDTSGEGAKRNGGRWNPPGTPIHYTSSSAALAVLEYMIHVDPADLPPMALVTYQVPDDTVIDNTDPLPNDWQASPPPKQLATIGKRWADSQSALALRVPAVLFPNGPGRNILINPLHPDAKELATIEVVEFEFDQRLFKG